MYCNGRIYFPIIESKVKEIKPKDLSTPSVGGTENILLAEDEPEVRNITKAVLEGSGCKVIEAVDGEDALYKFMGSKEDIQMFVSDVIMPKKNGKEVYDAIKTVKSGMKALFVSGYSENIVHRKGILKEGLYYIPKPVSPSDLLRKVRDVLDK